MEKILGVTFTKFEGDTKPFSYIFIGVFFYLLLMIIIHFFLSFSYPTGTTGPEAPLLQPHSSTAVEAAVAGPPSPLSKSGNAYGRLNLKGEKLLNFQKEKLNRSISIIMF